MLLLLGLHSLTITKLSEASYGLAMLTDLTVGPGGRCVALVLLHCCMQSMQRQTKLCACRFVTPILPQSFQTGRRILVLGDNR